MTKILELRDIEELTDDWLRYGDTDIFKHLQLFVVTNKNIDIYPESS